MFKVLTTLRWPHVRLIRSTSYALRVHRWNMGVVPLFIRQPWNRLAKSNLQPVIIKYSFSDKKKNKNKRNPAFTRVLPQWCHHFWWKRSIYVFLRSLENRVNSIQQYRLCILSQRPQHDNNGLPLSATIVKKSLGCTFVYELLPIIDWRTQLNFWSITIMHKWKLILLISTLNYVYTSILIKRVYIPTHILLYYNNTDLKF